VDFSFFSQQKPTSSINYTTPLTSSHCSFYHLNPYLCHPSYPLVCFFSKTEVFWCWWLLVVFECQFPSPCHEDKVVICLHLQSQFRFYLKAGVLHQPWKGGPQHQQFFMAVQCRIEFCCLALFLPLLSSLNSVNDFLFPILSQPNFESLVRTSLQSARS